MNDSAKKLHPHTIIALITIGAIGVIVLALALVSFFTRI